MPAISSLFLTAALVLAVLIGPQTRSYTWGPAILALVLSVMAALPSFWRKSKAPADFGFMALGALTATWFAWRAWISPVAEFGQADLLLVCSSVGAFVSIRGISGHPTAERILSWGITILLLANLIVIARQVVDPTYVPLFRSRAVPMAVTGFFAHYNEAANYLIASAMLTGAAALSGRHCAGARLFMGIVAISGVAGVWFTHSRGGILGAAIASMVFACIALIIAKRRGSKWFAPAVIAIPIIFLLIGTYLFMGWKETQNLRQTGTGITELLDNNCRLYFLGIAMSCIGLHPMAGGGSRSFSWECYRFVEGASNGDIITHKPDFVHNELIQSATDYGIVGATLLAGLLVIYCMAAILRVIFEERPENDDFRDAWRLGGIAALAGMLVQSCFSFVFHLMPGILLLGICTGQISRPANRHPDARASGNRILLSLAAVCSILLILPAGWDGMRVTRILWPTHFSKHEESSAEARIDALTDALRILPLSSFYQERGEVFQLLANSKESLGFKEPAERAITDYEESLRMNPFDPGAAINRANLLSQSQRDAEAEEGFAKAIQLQGGMEPGYRARFSLATHLLRKGLRLYRPENPEPAHDALEAAAEQIEAAVKNMHWVIKDMLEPRVSIHENLGTTREAAGDNDGALESYRFASALEGGSRVHYRTGVLIGKMAVESWSKRRPAEALYHFLEARKQIDLAKELPQGVTPSQRVEYIDYLDRTIAFLKGARVEPMAAPETLDR